MEYVMYSTTFEPINSTDNAMQRIEPSANLTVVATTIGMAFKKPAEIFQFCAQTVASTWVTGSYLETGTEISSVYIFQIKTDSFDISTFNFQLRYMFC